MEASCTSLQGLVLLPLGVSKSPSLTTSMSVNEARKYIGMAIETDKAL